MPGHRSAGDYVRLLNQHYVEIFMRNLSLNEGGHNKGKVFTFLFNIFRVFPLRTFSWSSASSCCSCCMHNGIS